MSSVSSTRSNDADAVRCGVPMKIGQSNRASSVATLWKSEKRVGDQTKRLEKTRHGPKSQMHGPRRGIAPTLVTRLKPKRMRGRRICAGMTSPRRVQVCANATKTGDMPIPTCALYAQNAKLLSTSFARSRWTGLKPPSGNA